MPKLNNDFLLKEECTKLKEVSYASPPQPMVWYYLPESYHPGRSTGLNGGGAFVQSNEFGWERAHPDYPHNVWKIVQDNLPPFMSMINVNQMRFCSWTQRPTHYNFVGACEVPMVLAEQLSLMKSAFQESPEGWKLDFPNEILTEVQVWTAIVKKKRWT